jgi:hypothetical protein
MSFLTWNRQYDAFGQVMAMMKLRPTPGLMVTMTMLVVR